MLREKIIMKMAEMIESDINYKEILDNLECPIYVTDARGITRYVNRAYIAENPMWDPAHLIGRNVRDIIKEGKCFSQAITPKVLQERREAFELLSHPLLPGKSAFVSGRPIYDQHRALKHVVSILYVDSFFQRLHTHFNYPLRQICSLGKVPSQATLTGDTLPIPLIGRSDTLNRIRTLLTRIAPTNVPVLITGESGTGKEVIASAIQRFSARADKPFIKVNCAAIPTSLLESELFGYDKGAFTGATTQGKPGFFEQANGGTLFLDEIGELPWEAQAKLLRVLQHQEIQRLGSTRSIMLDVRIIAATNASLQEKIQQRLFRSDLYYRLSIIPLHLPPLRERPEDIPLLIEFFSGVFDQQYQRIIRFDVDGIDRLKHHIWPGNVRELRNFLEYMYICAEENFVDVTTIEHWLLGNRSEAPTDTPLQCPVSELESFCQSMLEMDVPLKTIIDEVERCVLRQSLATHKTTYAVAKKLGVAQPTIVRKLHGHNLRPE